MSSKPSYFLFTRWTKGETVEKSLRVRRKIETDTEPKTNMCTSSNETTNNGEYHQNSIWDDDSGYTYSGGIGETFSSTGYTRQANKRDSFNEMLSHRDMHTQVGQNPFLAGESYLKHLKIQEDFLRPQNTNVTETKNTE